MADYELTLMVPVTVLVRAKQTVKEAFDYTAPLMAAWGKEQSGGQRTGYAVTLLASRVVSPPRE
jgi:hypothetical protein